MQIISLPLQTLGLASDEPFLSGPSHQASKTRGPHGVRMSCVMAPWSTSRTLLDHLTKKCLISHCPRWVVTVPGNSACVDTANLLVVSLFYSLAAEGLYPAPTVKVFLSVDSMHLGPQKHIYMPYNIGVPLSVSRKMAKSKMAAKHLTKIITSLLFIEGSHAIHHFWVILI